VGVPILFTEFQVSQWYAPSTLDCLGQAWPELLHAAHEGRCSDPTRPCRSVDDLTPAHSAGDTADSIPGVEIIDRIQEGNTGLIREYGTLENLFAKLDDMVRCPILPTSGRHDAACGCENGCVPGELHGL
jgi:hypothetical protein